MMLGRGLPARVRRRLGAQGKAVALHARPNMALGSSVKYQAVELRSELLRNCYCSFLRVVPGDGWHGDDRHFVVADENI